MQRCDLRTSLELLDRVLSREHGILADDPALLPSHLLQTLRLGDRPAPEDLARRAVDALRGRTWLELLERPPGLVTAVGELVRLELGGPVAAVAVSPDGGELATLRLDGQLRMHRLPLGLPRWETQAHEGPAEALDRSPSARLLATADDAGTIALWDARMGATLGSWQAHTGGGPAALRWWLDDELLVSAGGDGAIRLWRLAPRSGGAPAELVHEMRSRDGSTTRAIAWAPDGVRFATGGQDAVVRVWALGGQGPGLLGELEDNERGITGLAWDPHGTRLASSAADGALCIWDLAEGSTSVIRPRDSADPVRTLAFSPDGSRLAFDAGAYRIGLLDAGRGAVTYLSGHRHVILALAWGPDGSLVSCSTDWTVRIWDPDAAVPEAEAPRGHHTLVGGGLALSHDGECLASGDYGSSIYGSLLGGGSEVQACTLAVRRVEDGSTIPGEHESYTFRGITAIAWSADDRRLALCCRDGSVAVLHAATGHGEERWLAHAGEAWGASWSPDGRIATGGQDGEVVVWGAGGATASYSAGAPVRALAWSPDGSRLAAGCDDGSIACLRTPDLTEIWERPAHDGRIHRVTWSADGRTLLTSGADGLVWVWDAEGAIPLAGHRQGTQIYDAAFVPGGRVCSGGDDGTFDVWDASSGELVTRVVLPGSLGHMDTATAGRIAIASHGAENGFRPVVYRFALRESER